MDVESIVVGAGVVGLAIGRSLAHSGRDVLVLERNNTIGQETSSRNSEVIHAGIYYPKGSLKAELCARGKRLLYDYCKSFNIDHRCVGKLIVAATESQIPALQTILAKGVANGVKDLTLMSKSQLLEIEPELQAVAAVWSPSTGIINSHELMLALQGDMEAHGGILSVCSNVKRIQVLNNGFRVELDDDNSTSVTCKELINCCGLGAQTLSQRIEGIDQRLIPPQFLSRGCYFSLVGRSPFKHLIYPMPNNEGLGVHLTLDLQGRARFGPDTEWVDKVNYDVDPKRAVAFYGAIRSYYPELKEGQLEPAYAGIRPKIAGPGQNPADFDIQGPTDHGTHGFVALYGIESPGLTSSLAIAEVVVKKLDENIQK